MESDKNVCRLIRHDGSGPIAVFGISERETDLFQDAVEIEWISDVFRECLTDISRCENWFLENSLYFTVLRSRSFAISASVVSGCSLMTLLRYSFAFAIFFSLRYDSPILSFAPATLLLFG